MKLGRMAWILGLFILFTLATGALAQEKGKAFLWDGTHWAQVSMDTKAGYVFGIGNLADFEVGAGAGKGRGPCISRAFVDELKTKTVNQIIQEVDKYYQENPGKLNTSVIEAILRRLTALCPAETAEEKKK